MRMKHHSETGFCDVDMFSFRNTILIRRIRTSYALHNTTLMKKRSKTVVDELCSSITLKRFDFTVKLINDILMKLDKNVNKKKI